jgi:hypothetical protein
MKQLEDSRVGQSKSRVIARGPLQCFRSTAAVMASLLAHARTLRERTSFTSALRVTLPVLTEMMFQLPKHNSFNVVNLTPPFSFLIKNTPKNVST